MDPPAQGRPARQIITPEGAAQRDRRRDGDGRSTNAVLHLLAIAKEAALKAHDRRVGARLAQNDRCSPTCGRGDLHGPEMYDAGGMGVVRQSGSSTPGS